MHFHCKAKFSNPSFKNQESLQLSHCINNPPMCGTYISVCDTLPSVAGLPVWPPEQKLGPPWQGRWRWGQWRGWRPSGPDTDPHGTCRRPYHTSFEPSHRPIRWGIWCSPGPYTHLKLCYIDINSLFLIKVCLHITDFCQNVL